MMSNPVSVVLGERVIAVGGDLDADSVAAVWGEIEKFNPSAGVEYTLDCSGLARCTGAGTVFLFRLMRRIAAAGGTCRFKGLQPGIANQLVAFDADEKKVGLRRSKAVHRPHIRFFSAIGKSVHDQIVRIAETLGYVGEVLVNFGKILLNPRLLRWGDFWLTCQKIGYEAVPVVMLLGFLLGLILAFQSAIPMKMFGAQIYVASLVGLSLIRELGTLMTLIIFTGRSGSAFAAEIGTMQVNEEIDALRTMGLDPVRFLALPRILASIVMMPLLTLFTNLAGLAGAFVVMFAMDYSFGVFYSQLTRFVGTVDLIGGLVKAMVFGLLVAAVGCQRGLETGKDAEAVGRSTTSAVVSGIILITLADGIFAVVFYAMGW